MKAIFSVFLWLYFSFLFAVFFVLISIVFLITFPFDPYRKVPNKVLSIMAKLMMKASPKWKINIKGTEKFDPEVPTVFVANHQSFLDMALAYHLPWQMKWVSKRSLAFIPVMGWLVWLTGHLTINRSSKSALKKLANLVQPLKDKIPVMIFPEGTRTLDGDLKRFKNGAFLLAHEYGFNIQPMVLDGGHIAMKSGSKIVEPEVSFSISILDPVKTSEFKDINTLKDHAYQLIDEELKRIRSK
ncbi:MAG: lysophospholipid acyltransferase family protein [Balneola sp.]